MQPIKRTTVLEEVNGSEVPLEPLHYPVAAPPAEELPPMRVASSDGQICAVGCTAVVGIGDRAGGHKSTWMD